MVLMNIAIVVVDCAFALLVSLVLVAQKIYVHLLDVDLMAIVLLASWEEICRLQGVLLVYVIYHGWGLLVRLILAKGKPVVEMDTANRSVRLRPIASAWEVSLVPPAIPLVMGYALAMEESTRTTAVTHNPHLPSAIMVELACTVRCLDNPGGVALPIVICVMAFNAQHLTMNANKPALASTERALPFLVINPMVLFALERSGVFARMVCALVPVHHLLLHHQRKQMPEIAQKFPFL